MTIMNGQSNSFVPTNLSVPIQGYLTYHSVIIVPHGPSILFDCFHFLKMASPFQSNESIFIKFFINRICWIRQDTRKRRTKDIINLQFINTTFSIPPKLVSCLFLSTLLAGFFKCGGKFVNHRI